MTENYQPEHRAGDAPEDFEDNEPVVGDAPPRAHTLFSNSVYDKLKFVALVLLPALGTLYFTIAATTGLPYGEEVVGIVLAVDTFLGVLLGLSTNQYRNNDDRFDGEVHVQRVPGTDESTVGFAVDSRSVVGKDEIVLKVQK